MMKEFLKDKKELDILKEKIVKFMEDKFLHKELVDFLNYNNILVNILYPS